LPIPSRPPKIEARFQPPATVRQEILILGSAGQRIVTAGEILCLAGMTAGWHATMKNDYPITVLRGHSVSELVLSPEPVDYTGIEEPKVVLALAEEEVIKSTGSVDTAAILFRSIFLRMRVPGGRATSVRAELFEIGSAPERGAELPLQVRGREAVADFADADAVRGEVEDGDRANQSRDT